jgi:hypothetical protein
MNRAKLVAHSLWQRPPILIIGAHRSGTTATVRALRLLGLEIGERLDSHEEPRALQRLHEQYLHRLGAAWHEPASFLEWVQTPQGQQHCAEYLHNNVRHHFADVFGYRKNLRGLWRRVRLKLGKPWGWKEPRTTLFASCWLELFPDARIVHVIRHPLAVAMSIRQRELKFQDGGDPPTGKIHDLDYCLRLVTTYIEWGENLAARTPHYRRVRFEDVQANPSKSLAVLADFCGLRFTTAQMIEASASIRPEKSPAWHDLPVENRRDLVSNYPIAARLGYGWDTP